MFSKLKLNQSPEIWDQLIQYFGNNPYHTENIISHKSRLQSIQKEYKDYYLDAQEYEYQITGWFINFFNHLFSYQNVILYRGNDEPEYFPATEDKPAKIVFAHGYFSSALHEISHWCIAGKRRRKLNDFGYWYTPDGRTKEQQLLFEKVEVKPQAIECLLTLMCQRNFNVSIDNLNANYDTSKSSFKEDVYQQVICYLNDPHQLPSDTLLLLNSLYQIFWFNDQNTTL